MNKTAKQPNKFILFGAIGALVGATAGTLAGVLMADDKLRHEVYLSYKDLKGKSVEILEDIDKMRETHNKRKNARLLTE